MSAGAGGPGGEAGARAGRDGLVRRMWRWVRPPTVLRGVLAAIWAFAGSYKALDPAPAGRILAPWVGGATPATIVALLLGVFELALAVWLVRGRRGDRGPLVSALAVIAFTVASVTVLGATESTCGCMWWRGPPGLSVRAWALARNAVIVLLSAWAWWSERTRTHRTGLDSTPSGG